MIKNLVKKIHNKLPISLREILIGTGTYIPAFNRYISQGTGGTNSARYCYSVWLRHIKLAYENGLTQIPEVVAELGPGDSIGIGLAAILSGTNKYYGLDIVRHNTNLNFTTLFNELIFLFKNKTKIPDEDEFPNIKPKIDNLEFPSSIISDKILKKSLSPKRINSIKEILLQKNLGSKDEIEIKYYAPWMSNKIIKKKSADMIISQAVLEHIDELDKAYLSMSKWLKQNRYMSHQIDFKSHGHAKEWNGHWNYSRIIWKLIRGNRNYMINREPLSTHLKLLNKYKFQIENKILVKSENNILKKRLSKEFKNIENSDLICSGAYIFSKKLA